MVSTVFLIGAPLICFVGAYVSAVAGLGGGLLIVAFCAQIMPLAAVVPLTGVFVLAGQVARIGQFYPYLDWSIARPFIPGSLLGAVLGSHIYFSLPENAIALMLGSVMLWFCWVPSTPASQWLGRKIPHPWFWVGIIHTFISTLAGVGGLFQSMMVNRNLSRQAVVGTIAGTLLAMSVFKTVAYVAAGFDYRPYLMVIVLSWLAAVAGTYVGKNSLSQLSDRFFQRLLKAVVTIFSLRLFWQVAQRFWT
ncbi:MAG: sulfite exporter TauE/SafE family protein [Pseudomonadales bacterium]|nr:sulfite exporter TauE/SafE family protein [Pseudomonadales bacterium]